MRKTDNGPYEQIKCNVTKVTYEDDTTNIGMPLIHHAGDACDSESFSDVEFDDLDVLFCNKVSKDTMFLIYGKDLKNLTAS